MYLATYHLSLVLFWEQCEQISLFSSLRNVHELVAKIPIRIYILKLKFIINNIYYFWEVVSFTGERDSWNSNSRYWKESFLHQFNLSCTLQSCSIIYGRSYIWARYPLFIDSSQWKANRRTEKHRSSFARIEPVILQLQYIYIVKCLLIRKEQHTQLDVTLSVIQFIYLFNYHDDLKCLIRCKCTINYSISMSENLENKEKQQKQKQGAAAKENISENVSV